MPNQIEYKRVTKNVLISQVTVLALSFLASGLIFEWTDWIMLPIWLGMNVFFLLLYEYALDKKKKPIIITPIYLFISACLQTFLYFVLSNDSFSLAIDLILVIGLFLANVIGAFKQIGYPPYVIDGKYDIEDAKKYSIKQLKKLALVFGILIFFLIIFYLSVMLWKNSLLGNN